MSVVFGACSPVGRAIVTRLAFAGQKVAAIDTNRDALGKMEDELNKVGGNVKAVGLGDDEPSTMAAATEAVGGTMSGLVFVPPPNEVKGDIINTSVIQFNTVFAQRLTLPFRIIKAAIPHLKQSSNGSVVVVNSAAAFTPFVDLGLFSAASTGLVALVKNLSVDPGVLPIRVNQVVLSTVHSDGSGGFWEDKEKEPTFAGAIPVGRVGAPTDVASAVEFLLSNKARYITGEAMVLSGGMQLRL